MEKRFTTAAVSLDRLNKLLGMRADIAPKLVMVKSGKMVLATNNENVIFWVVDDMREFVAINLQGYDNHQTYTLTLYIEGVTTYEGRFDIFGPCNMLIWACYQNPRKKAIAKFWGELQ